MSPYVVLGLVNHKDKDLFKLLYITVHLLYKEMKVLLV